MVEEVAAKKESAEVAGKNDCAEVAGKNDSAEVATKDDRAEVAEDEENAVTGAVKIQSTPVKGMELGNASTKVIKVKIDDDLILGEKIYILFPVEKITLMRRGELWSHSSKFMKSEKKIFKDFFR